MAKSRKNKPPTPGGRQARNLAYEAEMTLWFRQRRVSLASCLACMDHLTDEAARCAQMAQLESEQIKTIRDQLRAAFKQYNVYRKRVGLPLGSTKGF